MLMKSHLKFVTEAEDEIMHLFQACQKVPHSQFQVSQVLVKKSGIQVRSGQVFSSIRSISGHLRVNSGHFYVNFKSF